MASNRVVFNIPGNEFRLVVAVAYRFKALYIYQTPLKQVAPYFDNEPDPDSDAGAHFEALITLIVAYEAKHYPVDAPDAVEAIKFRMEQQGLTVRDLGPMIGSRGRVSEVLNRKRPLSMAMVWRLHQGLGMPAESLIRPRQL